MKRILYILLVALAWGMTAQAQPKAEFDKKTHQFGTILWKNPATVTFKITNSGDKPLVISNITTSCGCTEADWTKTPIAPGASGTITTTYDAKALGRFQKSIGVYCNAEYRPIYLSIRGEVTADPKKALVLPYQIGDIKLDKDVIEFDDANKGDKPFVEILVANTSDKNYQPVLMHLPPYLSAEATPAVLPKEGYGKIKVTLDTEKLPKFGVTQATVYLSRFLGDKVGEENAIPVSAVLLPDFSQLSQTELQNPPAIELSTTDLNVVGVPAMGKKSQNIVIKNVGKRNLEITDVQVFDPSVGVHLKKHVLKPGAKTNLKVTVYGSQLKNQKRTPRIMIITNDPNRPKMIVNVKATSK
ncbi:MAG: DUF1573 domain-containing protein [Bacteroides sp.]|nr:DUF1573 domain-containing protein [Bacteroides sp.]MBQ8602187.1 DUF1573 domain-containing protein [Bacteroides sp.]